ncbi:hypothetical protein [Deinococcus radiophilus]|uniref:Uncharacterized protein n=1 Tax=Deinococcus radiophilus TaxID=32062 RepID=A0A3S0KH82_9DEIO|nr:hypothetical protein [Deinococcus radiophilus]RTR30768.1 hypothetical protein EJ104_00485 [Deinococcus radiophilus]UFA51322.1 hypothetical protein LMT64_05355 [Deinococcus radiophilus]
MRAYRGVVKNGKVELQDAELPEGTQVTVTVGEPELLLATLLHWLRQGRRVRVSLGPLSGMTFRRTTKWREGGKQGG